MMNFRTFFLNALVLCVIMIFTSCQSQEEKVISKIHKLAEYIEDNGDDFDEQDWNDVINDCNQIHKEMQTCEFTTEQLRELGKVEQELSVAFISKGTKAFGENMSNFLGGLGAFAGGFMEGIEEGNATDLEELELNIEEGVDNFLDEIKY